MIYKAFYKCRLCGETYEDGTTTGNKEIIDTGMSALAHGWRSKEPMFPSMTTAHRCDDYDTGIADFQGFKGFED